MSHPISQCSLLTKADKADLRSMDGADNQEQSGGRSRSYDAPGWDVLEDQTDNESSYETEINDESYGVFSSMIGSSLTIEVL